MRIIIPLMLLLFVAGAPVAHADPVTTTEQAIDADLLSRACSLRGRALDERVALTVVRNPNSAAEVARLARGCSCEQATSMARGVMRAVKQLRTNRPDDIRPIYGALADSCSASMCRADNDRRRSDPNARRRCENADARREWSQADALKVRAPRSADCFCAAAASLGAQMFANGADGSRDSSSDGSQDSRSGSTARDAMSAMAAQRFGFFPDEGTFGGGGVGPGFGVLAPQLSVTRN